MAPSAEIAHIRPDRTLQTAHTRSSKSLTITKVHEIADSTHRPQDLLSLHHHTLILNPSFITTDFDALRFEAAAYNQLPSADSPYTIPSTPSDSDSDSTSDRPSPVFSTKLISSPYNTPGHYLDISALSTPSRLFALALTALQPTYSRYATEPYTQSLNFETVLSVLRQIITRVAFEWRETSFYVVVFRSQLRHGVDQDWLYKLDFESHREACESGGLLKYWFGKADLEGERRNLATCFWHSKADAVTGGAGPWHAKARRAGRELYASIVFTTHRFTVLDGAEGYRFEDWKD
ncbi:hypothetical protein E8E12_005607 [Didymella heteroderae]|uniref:Uncharacterized protein n=1 Tax=Didymella heteroderae TaxID=1769908 RepID=A0A9P4WU61_9PLEO|nr:hypothetical protein E8E12_005607 [Didymella heteroderae]